MDYAAPVTDLPWGTTANGELNRQGVVVGALLGTLAVFTTFPLGICLSCMGLDRVQTNPAAARKLMLWSWILFVPGTVLAVAALGMVAVATLT